MNFESDLRLMDNQPNNSVKFNKALVLLSVITVAAGFLTAFLSQLGIVFTSVTAGCLAGVFLVEERKKVSYVLPFLLLLLDLVFNSLYSLNCLASVIVALLMYFCFKKGIRKSECVVYCTLSLTAFIGIGFILAAFYVNKSFDFARAMEYYRELIDTLKADFAASFSQIDFDLGDANGTFAMTEEEIFTIFDTVMNTMIAFIATIAFAVVGVASKIFSLVGEKCLCDPKPMRRWRFRTPSIFAYFYYVLTVAFFFLSSSNSILSITAINLFIIFMFVYAYLGFGFAKAILTRSIRKPGISALILWISVIFLGAAAVQILSYVGAFMSIMTNKMMRDTQ